MNSTAKIPRYLFVVVGFLLTSTLVTPRPRAAELTTTDEVGGEDSWAEALDEADRQYLEILKTIELNGYNSTQFADTPIFSGYDYTWKDWKKHVTEIGLAKMITTLQDHLIEALTRVRDNHDAVVELSGRLKLVCDLGVDLAIDARDHLLRKRAKELLRALYFDEENPAAGIFYFLGRESSAKRQAPPPAEGEQPAYAEALDYFALALQYAGNSKKWGDGIRAQLHLEMARHRAGPVPPAGQAPDLAFWGGQEQLESEYRLALADLDKAFSWGLLNATAVRDGQDLYGRLVGQLMADLYIKDPEGAVKIANERLSAEFGWIGKDIHFVFAAQAAEALAPKPAEGSPPATSSPEYVRWQKKSMHFCMEAFKLLQERLARRVHELVLDPYADDHGLGFVHYAESDEGCSGTRVWDCQLIDFVMGYLFKNKDYLSQLEVLVSYKKLLCSNCAVK